MADAEPVLGGVVDAPGNENSLEIQELGHFAVDEFNKKSNALLEFVAVEKVKTQVVAGTAYYLTIAVNEDGEKKLYEAKVWVKPSENFKELEDFQPLQQADSSEPAQE